MHAEKCPVCLGTGRVPDFWLGSQQCHGCLGKGWVSVPDEVYYGTPESTVPMTDWGYVDK